MANFKVFNNKIAIVTGAASGLGQGFATVMAKNGATIVAADINLAGVKTTAERITADGGIAEAHQLDVRDSVAVTKLVDDTVAKHGRIDYMFNNAGIATQGPVQDIPVEHWDEIIDINLKGVVYGSSAAYKHMVEQGSGHVVNTASLAGLVPSPLLAPYSTVKFGVVGLSQSLRAEARAHGVNVTALCPAFIESGIYEAARYSGGLNETIGRAQIPRIVPLDKGVHTLLKGVAANKQIVTLPLYGHVFWRGYRLMPMLGVRLSGLLIKRQLKALAESENG
ncbi:MAG: SDR family NAD(P)-dependent oxidoreductase [Thermoleophilia bacterium]|nr:SDR family NAD(P)-dependent oxidoreductase [Thermoleophilia bacterium]